MKRVGYTRYVAQGGDWGSPVSNEMAKLAPPELLGIHVNLPGVVPPEIIKVLQCGDPPPASLSVDEEHAFRQLELSFSKRRAYAQIMATRPQTLSGLADSPSGLAAWLLDHGDGYGQPAAPITSAVARAHGQRTFRWCSYARRRARQHHALLADQHSDFVGTALLGKQE